jgi:FAD/FMN-containing dehydrogenase
MTISVSQSDFLKALQGIVGEAYLLTQDADKSAYLHEWRGYYQGQALAVVKPNSTTQVSELVKLCVRYGVPIVPQGGNTGLVGGQTSLDPKGIVLSLTRMNKIRALDPLSDTLMVDAGVTLLQAQEAAESVDRLFPLSLASEGTCTIGGNIATNAGGTAVLVYGNTRDLVLGLEVVLADGRILNGLSSLRKDNTGFDLKNLFVGSEGALGIITGAALKLFPKPRSYATAFCAVPSPEHALTLITHLKGHVGAMLTTFELIPRLGIELVLKNIPNTRDPLSEVSPWYVLMELSSPLAHELTPVLETHLATAFEYETVSDAAIATSLDQRLAFWKLREAMAEAQQPEGGNIKFDVSVPVASVPMFIERATAASYALEPNCRPIGFGHFGDGNIHFDVAQPIGMDKAAYLARREDFNEAIHAIVQELHGSISAEHGIGRLKRTWLARVKSQEAMDLMRSLKTMLDPNGVLNPEVIV